MNEISETKNRENSNDKISINITKDDLYQYCSDFGLMLSWGIPIMKILDEMAKDSDNNFLKMISSMVGENILRGETISSTYGNYPGVFKPVFTKWVRIGERFGILDEAFLKMAGIIRFETLLTGSSSLLPEKELGVFLLKASQIILEKNNFYPDENRYKISPNAFKTMEKISGEDILKDWITYSENSESHNLFSISMVEYLTGSIHKRIANASFWHILGTAEEGGYLPEMMEIIGLYLTDKNNLLPDTGVIELNSILMKQNRSLEGILERLLEKIKELGLGTIKIENRNHILISEENETPLAEILGIAPNDDNEMIAVINRLKIALDLDPAEKRLAQAIIKEITIGKEKFIAEVNTTPPYSYPPQRLNVGQRPEKEKPELIEIKFVRAEDEK